ncbi:MAG: LysR family transcriptional regulator [Bacillus sp. (in: firmicutes)]
MRYYNVLNISLQQIRIFLKVMELRSYTRTAEYFHFTVSMVSKTISRMEKETGLILFLRKPRELVPTPAAVVLAREWYSVVYMVEQSLEKAHTAQDGARTRINFGFIDSSQEVDLRIQNCLIGFEELHPELDVRVEKLDMHELVERLHTGELDIICTASHEIQALESYNLPWKRLCSSHLAVYIPRSSPLFQRDSLQIADLKNESFIIPSPVMQSDYYTMLEKLCRSNGFTPKIAITSTNVISMLYSLKMQKGVVLGDEITRDWGCENVKQFILPEMGGTIISWNQQASPKCSQLADFMVEHFLQ